MIIESIKPESENTKESDTDTIDFKQFDGVIQFKIVYWGPGESGKTTNFMRLREKYHYTKLTDGYSVETTDGRTLWQDSVFLSFNLHI